MNAQERIAAVLEMIDASDFTPRQVLVNLVGRGVIDAHAVESALVDLDKPKLSASQEAFLEASFDAFLLALVSEKDG